jgi:hypothetical protein
LLRSAAAADRKTNAANMRCGNAVTGSTPSIRDEVDFERHVNYIHFNPVKHGLVTRVADWPYSSFHRYVAQGILPGDGAGDAAELFGRFGE